MFYFIVINYAFYNYLYGIDIALGLFLILSLLSLCHAGFDRIRLSSIFDVLPIIFFGFLILLSIPTGRFDYIEKDLALTLILILILKLYSIEHLNWTFVNLFFISLAVIFFSYWLLILTTSFASSLYLVLRGYEAHSYFLGVPRLNNGFLIYPIFLAVNWRNSMLAAILTAPATSVFLTGLVFVKFFFTKITLNKVIIFSFLFSFSSYFLLMEFFDIWTAIFDQKVISIANRSILEFPGLFGSLEYIRKSETLLFALAQKYGFLTAILSMIFVVKIFRMFNISNINIFITILLVSANPTSIGMCLLFSYAASRKNN